VQPRPDSSFPEGGCEIGAVLAITRVPSSGMSDATVSDRELILRAAATLNPHRVANGRLFGDVAACLVSPAGNLHSGVCIDTSSGTGFCAEHAAIASLVTAGEYRITKIVAVWRDEQGRLYVLPPCGRCREFIRQLDPANLDTEVILGDGYRRRLRELLPSTTGRHRLTRRSSTAGVAS
jgi:cytidine deaminase